ncbi:Ump1p KNAG_0A03440 [Huiozyma naganishii CBS 8797]|uniref:Uncharacterized protein n=1 Tax=Huiozyma naganishii (strain ATCC MYA-139 / BCRC 22969 / CBS 8797 / KCTC 17520 / NBRC 10181 / NCYC 3082 / Yp74L-3) TaxID=1071383 RepID=J7RTH5_HUIN7|nr:hypothetical protein KNAG_0A03440 [Kazachstania naganishii CBS 8797]CCK68027.1 hypothetical protein KNAG_0A03440 [Kazachstania naganishii CBS 8797]
MNVVPRNEYKSSVSSTGDALRSGAAGAPLATQMNGRHPLEQRVAKWEETQRKRQWEQYRQVFGVAEPMRRKMELSIVEATDFHPARNDGAPTASHQGSMHRDILLNKGRRGHVGRKFICGEGQGDGAMQGPAALARAGTIHAQFESRLGL